MGLKKRFLGEHPGLWVGPFTAAVRAGAQSEFYRHLAQLTAGFVKIEAGGDNF
jgi:TorA maturation chaperone TorD